MSALPCLALLGLLSAAAPDHVSTSELYGHRLLLGPGGRPRVALGLASGRNEVELDAPAGLIAIGRSQAGAELSTTALGRRVKLLRVGGAAARLRYGVAVASLEGAERSRRGRVLAEWRARGERAFSLETGLVFGLSGTLVDNRATLVLVRASGSRVRTERAARELHDSLGIHTTVVPTVKALPRLEIDASGELAQAHFSGTVVLVAADGGTLTVQGIAEGHRRKPGLRSYPGAIAIAPDATGRMAVVNLTEIDSVLKGVVPAEMFASAPLESLKAQAVTARGAVFAKLGRRHFADPYTLCNDVHCQVYSGTKAQHPAASQAVDATRGELMFLAGNLVDSVYSSTCGGHTEDSDVAWDMPPKAALRGRRDGPAADDELARRVLPFGRGGLGDPGADGAATDLSDEKHLRAVLARPPDSYCARSTMVRPTKLRWTKRISSVEMDRLMFKYGVGQVRAIEVMGRGVSGRIRAIRVVGASGKVVIQREWPVRQALGLLNSGAFVLDIERGADGKLSAFVFTGMGWGHGVGMCQVGAIGMAEAGHDYRSILRHYYNGAEIRTLY